MIKETVNFSTYLEITNYKDLDRDLISIKENFFQEFLFGEPENVTFELTGEEFLNWVKKKLFEKRDFLTIAESKIFNICKKSLGKDWAGIQELCRQASIGLNITMKPELITSVLTLKRFFEQLERKQEMEKKNIKENKILYVFHGVNNKHVPQHIFSYLGIKDLRSLIFVSKSANKFAKETLCNIYKQRVDGAVFNKNYFHAYILFNDPQKIPIVFSDTYLFHKPSCLDFHELTYHLIQQILWTFPDYGYELLFHTSIGNNAKIVEMIKKCFLKEDKINIKDKINNEIYILKNKKNSISKFLEKIALERGMWGTKFREILVKWTNFHREPIGEYVNDLIRLKMIEKDYFFASDKTKAFIDFQSSVDARIIEKNINKFKDLKNSLIEQKEQLFNLMISDFIKDGEIIDQKIAEGDITAERVKELVDVLLEIKLLSMELMIYFSLDYMLEGVQSMLTALGKQIIVSEEKIQKNKFILDNIQDFILLQNCREYLAEYEVLDVLVDGNSEKFAPLYRKLEDLVNLFVASINNCSDHIGYELVKNVYSWVEEFHPLDDVITHEELRRNPEYLIKLEKFIEERLLLLEKEMKSNLLYVDPQEFKIDFAQEVEELSEQFY